MLLIALLAFVVLINCLYYFYFTSFAFSRPKSVEGTKFYAVSLLVCAKNEADNLKEHIPLWLQQDYPDFELILINDASSDDTLKVMDHFAEKDSRIKIVDVESNEAFYGSKKYALTLGIKKAANKRMLFTDADCRPASTSWIRKMVSQFSEEKQLILGYGAYQKRPGLLNGLIRYETVMTALQYFSYAKNGNPYMGVGRNLAYTSNIFYANGGFTTHMDVLSGDDDLFVNQVANSSNIALQYHPDAFTYSKPKQNWKDWFRQKKRHSSTARYYNANHKILLGLYYFFNFLFWPVAVLACLFSGWEVALGIVLFRLLVQYIVVGKGAILLKEPTLIPFIPFLELFLVCLQLSIFISSRTSKRSTWN